MARMQKTADNATQLKYIKKCTKHQQAGKGQILKALDCLVSQFGIYPAGDKELLKWRGGVRLFYTRSGTE